MSSAANSTAPAAENGKKTGLPRRQPMRRRTRILLYLVSFIMMGVLRTGFMFVVIAMLPSIVTYYIDQSKRQYIFKTIFACNLSGVMPFIARMLHDGPSSATMEEIMGSANNWILIYGSALVGFFLIRLAPMIAHTMINGFHRTQVARLARNQKRIENEWGQEVTQFSQHHHEEDEHDPWAIPEIKIRH